MSGLESFSAADSFVGYVYQCEYALFRALDVDDPAEGFMVELFDDVLVKGVRDDLELIQLKHHDPSKSQPFTDRSADLWKTIRNWSSLVRDGAVDPAKTSFFLLTTASASPSSMLIEHLAPKGIERETRNFQAAKISLMKIAMEIEAGTTVKMKKNVAPFLALPTPVRDTMIANMTIVSGGEVIESLRKKIIKRLMLTGATTKNLESLAQSLVGWWYWAVVERMRSEIKEPISKEIIYLKLSDLVAQYVVSSLPLFEDILNPSTEQKQRMLQRLFVQQLIYIGHAPNRTQVAGALVDLYKADGHVKRWLESLRLQPKELQEFRDQLHGHWSTKFGEIEPDIDECIHQSDAEPRLAKLGRTALSGSLSGSQARLKDVGLDYLRRGVLHLMANEPVIGWHPYWETKFKTSK